MDVLPRLCARLLLLSLLCATGLCQRIKSECSRGRSICGIPLVLPHGDCAQPSWAPEAPILADKTCCVPFLLFSLSLVFGTLLFLPHCCSVASCC